MKKKVLSAILAMTLATTLTGCGAKEEKPTDELVEDVVVEGQDEIITEEVGDEPAVQPEAEATPEAKPEPQVEQKPEVKPEAKPEQKPTVKPEPKPEVKPEPKPEVKPEPKPEVKPEPKPEEKPVPSISTSEALTKAISGVELPKGVDVDSNFLSDAYGIDSSILAGFSGQTPMMMVQATEVVVFQVKDSKDISAVKAGISKRQAALEQTWSQYLPDQYEIVQDSRTVVEGNYVLYVVSFEADKIVSNFKAAVK